MEDFRLNAAKRTRQLYSTIHRSSSQYVALEGNAIYLVLRFCFHRASLPVPVYTIWM